MLTIEADQDPLLLKVTPTKAHFRSGTAVGRCSAALEDHNANLLKYVQLYSFVRFAGRTERGLGAGGLGATRWLSKTIVRSGDELIEILSLAPDERKA